MSDWRSKLREEFERENGFISQGIEKGCDLGVHMSNYLGKYTCFLEDKIKELTTQQD